MNDSTRFVLVAAFVASALASSAIAQIPDYTFHGSSGDQLGTSVRLAGDVNGDGFGDVLVGAPFASPNGIDSGRVLIFSGANGSVLRTFDGPIAGDEFGYSVAGVGDLDHDGFADIAVGSPKEANGTSPNVGGVWIFSGATGALLAHLYGSQFGEQFGYAISDAGDVDQDGVPDLLIASPTYSSPGKFNAGRVDVISGATFGIVQSYFGSTSGAHFGTSVAYAGDIDHDGFADLLVGAPGLSSGVGHAFVYSGKTGAQLFTEAGQTSGDQFGYTIAGARDLDNDGWPDFVVGAPFDSTAGASAGSIAAFSGQTGALIRVAHGTTGALFGYAVAMSSDVNGDGFAEIVAASPAANVGSATHAGLVTLLSGPTMTSFATFEGASGEELGISVGRGDVNGDGFEDVLLGAPFASPNGSQSGYAQIVLLGCPPPTVYCTAKQNSAGCTPSISSSGDPLAISGPDMFSIGASQLLDNKNGLLFWSHSATGHPFGGGTLCVAPPIARTSVQNSGCPTCGPCQGQFSFAFTKAYMAAENLQGGDTLYAQYWSRDPGFHGASNISLTDALKFTICK